MHFNLLVLGFWELLDEEVGEFVVVEGLLDGRGVLDVSFGFDHLVKDEFDKLLVDVVLEGDAPEDGDGVLVGDDPDVLVFPGLELEGVWDCTLVEGVECLLED